MKCLRISNGKGEFSLDGASFTEVDSITKDDILNLLETALDKETAFEMDVYDAESIQNPAHRIIYGNLYEKFKELIDNKQQFVDDIEDLYKDAYEQYRKEDTEETQNPELTD